MIFLHGMTVAGQINHIDDVVQLVFEAVDPFPSRRTRSPDITYFEIERVNRNL